jgi:hypothetical protein
VAIRHVKVLPQNMNAQAARKKIEALSIVPSDESFFKYLKAGDLEVVELFLDSGVHPDILDSDRNAAVVVATQAGQKELARFLLARGASPEPLLNRPMPKKDKWDKMTASSAILSFISSVLIAAVGGYFTYSYNQRQIDLNRTQSEHDSATKDQSNKVLELEAVQKLIPTLTSKDEQSKAAALIAIQDLAHPELAAHLATLFKGAGSVQYLQQAASSENPNAKRTAVLALSTIASGGTSTDSQLASRALSSVFDVTKAAVVKITATGYAQTQTGSGVILTSDGYILTIANVIPEDKSPSISITTSDKAILPARMINYDRKLDLAILKVESTGLTTLHLAANPAKIGSEVIGIGYTETPGERAFVGSVTAVDDQHIFFSSDLLPGVTGGPLLDATGDVVGLMFGRSNDISTAIRSDFALYWVKYWKVPVRQ